MMSSTVVPRVPRMSSSTLSESFANLKRESTPILCFLAQARTFRYFSFRNKTFFSKSSKRAPFAAIFREVSKNTSFTLTYLVLKLKEVPSKTENGKKMTWHLRCRRSFQLHQRAKVRRSDPLWFVRAFRFFHVAPQSFLASFALFSCMASFLSTTSIASLTFFWRPQQGSRIDIGERGDWPDSVGEDRQHSVALETASIISLCSTIYWQFHLWLGKEKREESSVWGEHEKGRSGSQLGKALDDDERQLGCLGHRRAKRPRPDILWSPIRWPKTNQWSPVSIILRNYRETEFRKTTRQTAATSEGKTELECSR